jgi:hypothetical protein
MISGEKQLQILSRQFSAESTSSAEIASGRLLDPGK